MIRALEIHNFKCFEKQKFEFAALTLLSGLNGMGEENEGQMEQEHIKVTHASEPDHIKKHSQWIQRRLQQDIPDGIDLSKRKAQLLPSLIFCATVTSQLEQLSPTMLGPVARRLFELQNYCLEWRESAFDPKQLPTKASPESQATLNQYAKERTFLCPDNDERIFSWHPTSARRLGAYTFTPFQKANR